MCICIYTYIYIWRLVLEAGLVWCVYRYIHNYTYNYLLEQNESLFFSWLVSINQTKLHFAGSNADVSKNNGPDSQQAKRETSYSDLGPLKDNERRDVNCAVKEYLLLAGYRLTAMTFYEEVSDYQCFCLFLLYLLQPN